MIVIGFDENKKAKIFEIGEQGQLDLSKIFFHAIGSGGDQAINTLMFQGHSKEDGLLSTIYDVYKAKKKLGS